MLFQCVHRHQLVSSAKNINKLEEGAAGNILWNVFVCFPNTNTALWAEYKLIQEEESARLLRNLHGAVLNMMLHMFQIRAESLDNKHAGCLYEASCSEGIVLKGKVWSGL